MRTLLVVGAVFTILGLLRLTSPAIRDLTYRKGAGWYLAPNLQLQPKGGGDDQARQREMHTSPAAIRWWVIGGLLLFGMAIAACVIDYAVLGIVIGIFAFAVLGMAIQGYRTNRWLRDAASWNTGHRHDIPDPHHHE